MTSRCKCAGIVIWSNTMFTQQYMGWGLIGPAGFNLCSVNNKLNGADSILNCVT